MKKLVFAILTAAVVLGLTGCPEKDSSKTTDNKETEKTKDSDDISDKDIKKFIPAERINGKIVEGLYMCNTKSFFKKTDGYIGKKEKAIIGNNDEKIEVRGINVTKPSKNEKMYIILTASSYINTPSLMSVFFEEDLDNFDFSDNGIKQATNIRTGGLIEWGYTDEDNKIYPGSIIVGNGKNTGIIGRYGKIDEREVIVDEENKIVFTKMNEDDVKKLAERHK